MEFIISHIFDAAGNVWGALLHNWPFLLVSTLIAVLLKQYLNTERVAAFLRRYQNAGVLAATAAAVGTPLCSCGTTAIVLGMMAGSMPWAPIVAFMVSSPLTSPEGLIYSAGLFGWPFAIAFFIASIVLGLFGGVVTAWLENRGWLRDQARFRKESTASCAPAPIQQSSCSCSSAPVEQPACSCSATPVPQPVPVRLAPAPACCASTPGGAMALAAPAPSCGCGASISQPAPSKPKFNVQAFGREFAQMTVRLLLMFLGFAFIGYFLNSLIPAEWVAAIFGGEKVYGVPLAATLGLPFYVNSEASLPLVRAMLDAGMSPGAALAFLITGSGTSFGAIAGAMTIARWRVIGVVVATLWIGAVVVGLVYNLL